MSRTDLPYSSKHPKTADARRSAVRASFSASALIVAAAAIGLAIHQHGGEYTPLAIALITVALGASIIAVFFSNGTRDAGDNWVWVDYAMGAALTLQFFALFILWPVGVDQGHAYLSASNRLLYLSLLTASGAMVLFGFLDLPALRRVWFPALLLLHSLMGFWTVRSSPLPHIDVWYFQQIAPQALLDGKNPFDAAQVRFPDIYLSTRGDHQRVYGPGMVIDDRLQFGFPYPPVSLYCSTLGYVLGHDTRYAQALALTLAGLFIGYSGRGLLPKLAAALLLFTPTAWFMLGRAWTEPFVVMFLAATVFCACRKLNWLVPIALGLFIASKQYVVLAAPLSFLLIEDFDWQSRAAWRAWGTLLAKAMLVAAVVTLPMAVWNPRAFWFSLVTVQKEAPFRWDALSYLVWIAFNIHSKYTRWVWLAFVAAVPALLLAVWKSRRGPAGFAAALALVYLVFIAFNKQAFCNYYFFVIGCLCCAIGAMRVGDSPSN